MTTKKAKELGFTHKGLFYGFIPVFFNLDEMDVTGTNRVFDIALETLSKTHVVLGIDSEFHISKFREL